MQKEIPIRNKGPATLYVAGKAVPAGETRMFAEHLVPPHLRPSASAPAVNPVQKVAIADNVLALLGESIKNIAKQLPALSTEELDRLEAGEKAGEKVRAGLISAIAEERLRRAADDTKVPGAEEIDAWVATLKEMADEDLLAQIEAFKEDHGRLAIIQEVIDSRPGGEAK